MVAVSDDGMSLRYRPDGYGKVAGASKSPISPLVREATASAADVRG
jgi:hypothetical protein